MTEETLNDYVNKIQAFNMNEDKRFDAVHIKDAVMAGYNICRSECEKGDLEVAIRIGALEEENAELKERIKTLEQIKQEHTNYTIKVEEERTFVKDQLTKAKEIIKAFLDSSDLNIKHKAEEFLGEF